MITFYTIGFTKKRAQKFFELLKKANISKLVDIRINNSSQLAGFAKGSDLQFFVKELCNASYEHIIDMSPTKELLKDYTTQVMVGNDYVTVLHKMVQVRNIT